MEDGRDDNRPLPWTMIRNRSILWGALKPAILAVVMAGMVFAPNSAFTHSLSGLLFVALIPPAGAALVVYCVLEWRNGRTTISDEGLDVTDWRGNEIHVRWANMSALWMGAERNGEWLKLELLGDGRKPRMVNLLTRRRGSEDFEQLRDMIIARAGLAESETLHDFWAQTTKRAWRRV